MAVYHRRQRKKQSFMGQSNGGLAAATAARIAEWRQAMNIDLNDLLIANKAADDTDYTDVVNHQRYPRHPRPKISLKSEISPFVANLLSRPCRPSSRI